MWENERRLSSTPQQPTGNGHVLLVTQPCGWPTFLGSANLGEQSGDEILKPIVWALSPAQLSTYGVTLGKLSHLSVLKLPHLENEAITVPIP